VSLTTTFKQAAGNDYFSQITTRDRRSFTKLARWRSNWRPWLAKMNISTRLRLLQDE
jgi:hypothetical protein